MPSSHFALAIHKQDKLDHRRRVGSTASARSECGTVRPFHTGFAYDHCKRQTRRHRSSG
jgi:hypothetical protein